MTEAYPLQWPTHVPRHHGARTRANFSKQVVRSFAVVRDELLNELKLLGVKRASVVLSMNIPPRRDGLPYSGMRQPDDVGVAVYFTLRDQPKCFAVDKWDRVEDNMRAISLTINALRGLSRWGSQDMVDAAFQGFDALPASSAHGWWVVLDVRRDEPAHQIESRYRFLVKHAHPDMGGDADKFIEIQAAYNEFKRERGAL